MKYKKKLIRSTSDNNNIIDADVVVPLKTLSNFWRSLNLPLITCEIELDLSWSKECIVSERSITSAIAGNLPTPARQTTGATFQINKAKFYVLVVTLSINDNIKFLENIKQAFKRTI